MTYCYYRVIQKHSRSRKAHDVFDSLSHLRLVTMDPAVGTERLIVPPRAFASSQFHIFQQFGTDRAKPSAAMMLPFAIKADHQGYNFRFLLYFHTCLFFPFIYAKTPVPFPSDQTSIFLHGTAAGGSQTRTYRLLKAKPMFRTALTGYPSPLRDQTSL